MAKSPFLPALALAAACLGGCATMQARFDPWKGLPDADVEALKQGVFDAPKDSLFDAAAATLVHEPYLHWSIEKLDKADGLITANAGLLREVQIRISDADHGRSRMDINVPRRPLRTSAKIYVLRNDPSSTTAYEPDESDLGRYNVLVADASLDPSYLYSFTYRVLHDRSQVPYRLRAYETQDPAVLPTPVPVEAPAAQDATPTAAADASPTAGTQIRP
jgi:hypothetical protein